jgi:hypothetical protein
MSTRGKPALSVVRLLNDIADRRAILALLGANPGDIDADSIGYARHRIPPARPNADGGHRPDGDWFDGVWLDFPREDV